MSKGPSTSKKSLSKKSVSSTIDMKHKPSALGDGEFTGSRELKDELKNSPGSRSQVDFGAWDMPELPSGIEPYIPDFHGVHSATKEKPTTNVGLESAELDILILGDDGKRLPSPLVKVPAVFGN